MYTQVTKTYIYAVLIIILIRQSQKPQSKLAPTHLDGPESYCI